METRFYLEQGLALLFKRLNGVDRVAVVVYGNHNEVRITPTPPTDFKTFKISIFQAMAQAPKATGEDGIDLAYEQAQHAYLDEGSNQVLLIRDIGKGIRDPLSRKLRTTNQKPRPKLPSTRAWTVPSH